VKPDNENHIYPMNTYLHNLEMERNIYVIKEIYYGSPHPNGERKVERVLETTFDNGTNEERLLKAEHYFTIKHQNNNYFKSQGNKKPFKMELICLQNNNGTREEISLKVIV
jgi:hypothetical protein